MDPKVLADELDQIRTFFERSTSVLDESDSSFTPVDGTFTVANQVAHVARTVDWFVEGAFRPEGFDMDFPTHVAEAMKIESLEEARAWFGRSMEKAKTVILSKTPDELMAPLPAEGIMGGAPRMSIVGAISDHTAHHRGALTICARLCGKTPPIPYM